MKQTINITPKWQVYIPVSIREALNLKEPKQAEIRVEEGTIVIEPQKNPVTEMAGKYKDIKPKKKVNLETVRDEIDYSEL